METTSIPLRVTPRKRQSTDEEKGLGRKSEARALLEQDEATDDAQDEEEDLDLDEEGLPYELYKNDTHLPLRAQGGLNIRLWACIAVNALSTIAIVFVNKAIFSAPPPSLRSAQVSFATFHFFITTVVLYTLSQPVIGVFEAKRVDILKVLPLSLAMVANVVLQNAALANSSIQFNQVARVLLTPACAALNFIMYRQTLPWKAGLTLIPICVGVAVVSYFDTKSGDALNKPKETAPIGVVFALAGVCASAMYTVWVKPFHVKLECDSYQLLLNQSAVSVGAMLYIIPFSDNKAVWLQLPSSTWALVGLSGLLAACINISQFVIIKEAGAVSSTVVGHLKTCSIILLGWITSSHSFKDMSVIGFILAVSGIIMYSYITHKQAK